MPHFYIHIICKADKNNILNMHKILTYLRYT